MTNVDDLIPYGFSPDEEMVCNENIKIMIDFISDCAIKFENGCVPLYVIASALHYFILRAELTIDNDLDHMLDEIRSLILQIDHNIRNVLGQKTRQQ